MTETSIKTVWNIHKASDVSEAFQEPPGERIALLRVGRKKRHWGMVLAVLPFPALVVLFALSPRLNVGVYGDSAGKVVGLFALASALAAAGVLVEFVRLGFIPALYRMEWSPAGLRGSFLGRRIHIAPERKICVREYRPLALLMQTPDGRWFPVPKAVLRTIAQPIDDMSSG